LKTKVAAYLKLISSMVIFGSIGLFVRNIDLSSPSISFVRALVGALFLLLISVFAKQKLSVVFIRKHLLLLLISGAALGFNWIALFEAYKYASVAVATLCYYTAPMMVILLSPVVLKEKLTANKLVCVAVAVLGMMFVSGISGFSGDEIDPKGILLGLVAAVLYASVVMMNKLQKDIPTFDRTVFQLGTAALVLLPYCLFSGSFPSAIPSYTTILLLIALGIVHTGAAYYLYFSSMEHLPGQTMAIISYIDPVVAVMVSVLILRENVTWQEMMGAVLILGAAVVSELPFQRKERKP
jgi:RarD protein